MADISVKYSMSKKNYELVEYLLKVANKRDFNTGQEKLAWERGYLTALVASLMTEDSLVRSLVIHRITKKN